MYDTGKLKQAEYRENQIGTQFISCPSQQFTRVFINGEITSAENFPESQLFISYKISIPIGWKPQISEQYKSFELTSQQLKELNCLESVTQSTYPILQKNKDGSLLTKFYFCFPIDIQLLMKNDAIDWPVIHFQVFSRDDWDRIIMHGCGFIKVPRNPGYYKLSSETWKPIVDNKTRVLQFFLGGIIKTKNLQDVSKQQKLNDLDQPGPINRFNYKGISSGKVNITLNIATQLKRVKNEERVIYRDQKYTQQTEMKKKELTQNIPSFVNTGKALGSRVTNTKLQ